MNNKVRHTRDTALIFSYLTLVAELTHGVVSAVDADTSLGVTCVSVTIALALSAVGEVPESWLALVTPPAKCWLRSVTQTLS